MRCACISALLLMAGCLSPSAEEDTGSAHHEIRGGVLAVDYPEAVVVDAISGGSFGTLRCSGVLIAPRLVLTAAHCVGSRTPFGFVVSAPFAQARAQVDQWTHYDWSFRGNGVNAVDYDVALLHLDAAIELPAYAELPAIAAPAHANVQLLGRIHDGVTNDIYIGPEQTAVSAAPDGFAKHYAAPNGVLESGDSGGPALLAGTHQLVGVNSGARFTSTGPVDLIARLDAKVVEWIGGIVEVCGSSDCRLPVSGYVDAGPAVHPPCAGFPFEDPAGVNLCCTTACVAEAQCNFPEGTVWTVGGVRGAPDRCMRLEHSRLDWSVAECPGDSSHISHFAIGEQVADRCAFDNGDMTTLAAIAECDGRVLARMGEDLCLRCDPGQRMVDGACVADPLRIRDVTNVVRSATMSRTEYFLSARDEADWNYTVHLLGATQLGGGYSYPGKAREGYLLVGHTFDTVAPEAFVADIDYLDGDGAPRSMRAYFPAFTTTQGRKMLFWVAGDGSTFYADAEHDGMNFEASELLSPDEAIRIEHLAAARTSVDRIGAPRYSAGEQSMLIDRVAPGDSGLPLDGVADSALDVVVTGAVRDVRLVVEDGQGNVYDGIQWDTFTGDRLLPPALSAGFAIGAETWLLGVARGGILLNGELGDIRPLGHGRHRLRLYAPYAEVFEAHRFHVDVVFADGSVRSLTAPSLAGNVCSTTAELCHWAAGCHDRVDGYRCSCSQGFTGNGATCQTDECAWGLTKVNGQCVGAIRVIGASYGANCGAGVDAAPHINSHCWGKQRCDYTIVASVLGASAAPDCAKELTVEWACSPNGSGPNPWRNLTIPAEPGTTATLSCEPL